MLIDNNFVMQASDWLVAVLSANQIITRHQKIRTLLSYIVDTMAADNLVMQGARASAHMVLTLLSQNMSASAPDVSVTSPWRL